MSCHVYVFVLMISLASVVHFILTFSLIDTPFMLQAMTDDGAVTLIWLIDAHHRCYLLQRRGRMFLFPLDNVFTDIELAHLYPVVVHLPNRKDF